MISRFFRKLFRKIANKEYTLIIQFPGIVGKRSVLGLSPVSILSLDSPKTFLVFNTTALANKEELAKSGSQLAKNTMTATSINKYRKPHANQSAPKQTKNFITTCILVVHMNLMSIKSILLMCMCELLQLLQTKLKHIINTCFNLRGLCI